MKIIFDIIATLKISQSYYTGSLSRDFEIFLPPESAKVLQNLKVLPKIKENMLYLLAEKNDSGYIKQPESDTFIYFGLKPVNPYLLNFTVSPEPDIAGQAIFWKTETTGTTLKEFSCFLCGRYFSYSITGISRPLVLILADLNDREIEKVTIPKAGTGEAEIKSFTFDLKNLPFGYYKIKGDGADTLFFRQDEIAAANCFGIAEINIKPAYFSRKDFVISLENKKSKWSYYVIAKTTSDIAKLSVIDEWTDTDAEHRDKINFEKLVKADFATKLDPVKELTAAKIGVPEDRLVVFRSLTEVERKETGYKSIKLKRNGDVLIKDLPNPGLDKSTTEVLIFL